MVPLIYSEIGGITVASNAAPERDVRAALKRIDDRYMLDNVPTPSGLCWTVLCRVGSETPPMVVTNWLADDGTPLPLSSGLVEKVKRLRVDGRGVHLDVEVENARLVERRRAEFEEQIDDAARYRMRHPGQWRYFFGGSRINPLAVRAARLKASHDDIS